jgi:hypothetical protein
MPRWRPEGWENNYEVAQKEVEKELKKAGVNLPEKVYTKTSDEIICAAFEDGADEMLDALFKLAKESPTGTFTIDSRGITINLVGGGNEKE